jgi:PAS domain S-box-containing protein
MLDALPAAVYITDAQGRLTYFNSAAEKFFGRRPETGTDQWCIAWKIFQPDGKLLPYEQCPMAVVLRGGTIPTGVECMAERPDGSRFWFTPYPAAIRDSSGEIVGGINMLVDITERKQAETQASAASLLLSAIVDSSDDAIISKDLNGIITSWNKSAERLFGYTAEETIGKSITILIPPDRQDEEPNILSRLRRGERVDHFETIRRRKDGALLDISLTISPVHDQQGNIIGASKIARDITEHKRILSALLASEARFRQLADAMPQIVWTALPNGEVDYLNERWYQFTGAGREASQGMGWQRHVHPEDVQPCREAWNAAVQSGSAFTLEERLWDSREVRWRWFIVRAVAARDQQGAITKWFGSCTDIDDQKATEENLRRANQNLEQFAYSVSHDLQEPLRTVKIYSELLGSSAGDELNPQAREFLTYLRGGADRMEKLVKDLLTYTQVTKVEGMSETTDAAVALSSTIAGLAGAIAETSAQIIADPLPILPVHSAHVHQLFQNIIGNAIKYRSPDRAPVVKITANRLHDKWVFGISDNGIGINPAYKEKIFGLFKRLHTSDEYSGTGIGLAICRRIVDEYNGRIWVESEPGKGSMFRFTLPA